MEDPEGPVRLKLEGLSMALEADLADLFRGGEFFGYALQPESAEIRNNCLTVNIGYNF
jgi:hypothetical protein